MSILIVGCGLSGVVLAERFTNILNKDVLIIEKRDHIGGNVYDYVDKDTNILMNKYGAHLFHTDNEQVWEYINRFSEWIRWDHRVLAKIENKLINLPININTINNLEDSHLKNSEDMDKWLESNKISYGSINNGEEAVKSKVGDNIYEKIFKYYTFKQWNKYPNELDPSVLSRIPVRNNFDDRYFNDKYQVLPKNGYTQFIKNIIDSNSKIKVHLNTDFLELDKEFLKGFEHIIYTGPIDKYYEKSNFEKLEYRSINFDIIKIKNMNFFQPNSVVNYPEMKYPFTRIVEYKHFLNQNSDDTIIVKETTCDDGEPYYPVPNKRNLELYEKYKELSKNETNVHFIGRLANYKYFNMDQSILNSLEYFEKTFWKKKKYYK
jgi:UDP-galactopyranose mutase